MRLWIAILLAGCGQASDFAIRDALATTAVAVATGAAGAIAESAPQSAEHRTWRPPEQPRVEPPRVLVSAECGAGRSYQIIWPPGHTRWSCYFENSDGQRFACLEASNDPPPALRRWCKR